MKTSKKIFDIIHSKTPHNPSLKVVFHHNEIDIRPINIIGLDIKGDYQNNHTEFITITVDFDMSDFYTHLNKPDLITMTMIYDNIFKKQYLFKALPYLSPNDYTDVNLHYDATTVKRVEFQLIDESQSSLKNANVNGVFKDTTVTELLSLLNLSYPNVYIFKCDNERTYKQTIIPNTSHYELPNYLQGALGVYNGSINWYISTFAKDNPLSVYPLFNLLQDLNKDKLIIHVGNSVAYDDSKTSYAYDNKNKDISIIGNDFLIKDNDRNDLYGTVSTIESIDSDSITKRPFDPKSKSFDSSNITRRMTNEESNPIAKHVGITDNLYKHRSATLKSMISISEVTWKFSNFQLLLPNMPVRVIIDGRQYKGTLASYYAFYDPIASSETTKMIILIEKELKK